MAAILAAGCSRPAPKQEVIAVPAAYVETAAPHVRATGTIQALRSVSVQVPRISRMQGNLTVTKLVSNGTVVKPGDVLAEFDRTAQVKAARDASAKYDDLTHQVDQKAAEHQSNAAKRAFDMAQAEADLSKARLELRKGAVLSEIDRQKADENLKNAEAHVASLKSSTAAHERAEAAELQVLKLQASRQKLTFDRLQGDSDKLVLRAPIPGMIALQNIWRQGSMGHAQEGDSVWGGSPLLRLFDTSSMVLQLSVSETDGAILQPGAKARVHLDAYPDLNFTAHFDSASPVASAGMDSPIKTFTARFIFDQRDPHLLPDLAAAADVELNR